MSDGAYMLKLKAHKPLGWRLLFSRVARLFLLVSLRGDQPSTF